jgi:hypothetical protein
MLKFAFKDVNTKNSEPTYWTILFVMLKIYFIYKVTEKKSRRTISKFKYVVCLSDTCSSCHGVTERTCKQKSWLKCACFLYKIHVTLQWKWSFSNILLFYLDVAWFGRWPEPWNFKTSHFRILYSFPSRISALLLLHTKTDGAILLTTKVAR